MRSYAQGARVAGTEPNGAGMWTAQPPRRVLWPTGTHGSINMRKQGQRAPRPSYRLAPSRLVQAWPWHGCCFSLSVHAHRQLRAGLGHDPTRDGGALRHRAGYSDAPVP
jgi:hypothetical protein